MYHFEPVRAHATGPKARLLMNVSSRFSNDSPTSRSSLAFTQPSRCWLVGTDQGNPTGAVVFTVAPVFRAILDILSGTVLVPRLVYCFYRAPHDWGFVWFIQFITAPCRWVRSLERQACAVLESRAKVLVPGCMLGALSTAGGVWQGERGSRPGSSYFAVHLQCAGFLDFAAVYCVGGG